MAQLRIVASQTNLFGQIDEKKTNIKTKTEIAHKNESAKPRLRVNVHPISRILQPITNQLNFNYNILTMRSMHCFAFSFYHSFVRRRFSRSLFFLLSTFFCCFPSTVVYAPFFVHEFDDSIVGQRNVDIRSRHTFASFLFVESILNSSRDISLTCLQFFTTDDWFQVTISVSSQTKSKANQHVTKNNHFLLKLNLFRESIWTFSQEVYHLHVSEKCSIQTHTYNGRRMQLK